MKNKKNVISFAWIRFAAINWHFYLVSLIFVSLLCCTFVLRSEFWFQTQHFSQSTDAFGVKCKLQNVVRCFDVGVAVAVFFRSIRVYLKLIDSNALKCHNKYQKFIFNVNFYFFFFRYRRKSKTFVRSSTKMTLSGALLQSINGFEWQHDIRFEFIFISTFSIILNSGRNYVVVSLFMFSILRHFKRLKKNRAKSEISNCAIVRWKLNNENDMFSQWVSLSDKWEKIKTKKKKLKSSAAASVHLISTISR